MMSLLAVLVFSAVVFLCQAYEIEVDNQGSTLNLEDGLQSDVDHVPKEVLKDLGIDENTLFHYSNARASLARSSWPADHADNSRSKFTLYGGLPKHYKPSDVKVDRQPELDTSFTWLYTNGANSEFLYLMGSTVSNGTVVAKLDSQSLKILQKIFLPRAIYLGGLVMHANGNIYGIQSNIFYCFWGGDLMNMSNTELPTYLSPKLTMTNGLLVTSDGLIVAKQWGMNAADIIGFAYFKPSVYGVFLFFCVAYYFIVKRIIKAESFIGSMITSAVILALAIVTFFTVLSVIMASRAGGSINKLDFVLKGYFDLGNGGSEIKLIDPISLKVVRNVWSYERGSYARMTLSPVVNSDGIAEDAIFFLGDEHVFQYRWRPSTKTLYSIPNWTWRYRERWTNTNAGTGPALFNDTIFFTDNTVLLSPFSGNSYNVFGVGIHRIADDRALALSGTSGRLIASDDYAVPPSTPEEANDNKYRQFPKLTPINAAKDGREGFMFYSIVLNPVGGDFIVWDSVAHSVQARYMSNLTLHWELKGVIMTDCLAVASDKGHVYMTTFNDTSVNNWRVFMQLTGFDGPILEKSFLVANASTGDIISKHFLHNTEKIDITMIIGGGNEDVFVGGRVLSRIHV